MPPAQKQPRSRSAVFFSEAVAQALRFQFRLSRGVEPGISAAVGDVDPVNIAHELQCLVLADEFMQRTAEFVGDVVLPVGKCACASETVHDRTLMTPDAFLDMIPVDRAEALIQRLAEFKNGDLQIGPQRRELIGGEDPAGACAYNDHIIIHCVYHILSVSWL